MMPANARWSPGYGSGPRMAASRPKMAPAYMTMPMRRAVDRSTMSAPPPQKRYSGHDRCIGHGTRSLSAPHQPGPPPPVDGPSPKLAPDRRRPSKEERSVQDPGRQGPD